MDGHAIWKLCTLWHNGVLFVQNCTRFPGYFISLLILINVSCFIYFNLKFLLILFIIICVCAGEHRRFHWRPEEGVSSPKSYGWLYVT